MDAQLLAYGKQRNESRDGQNRNPCGIQLAYGEFIHGASGYVRAAVVGQLARRRKPTFNV